MTHEQTVVKLTDAQRQTGAAYGAPLQWGPGVTHEVAEWSGELCTTGVLHAYSAGMLRDAVALAVLMDSTHGGYGADARLWVCSAEGRSVSDGTKSGHTRLTTLRELPLPKVTIDQRVEVAIRCAQQSPGQTNEWTTWAAAWLDGTGRSAWAAADAAWAAALAEAAAWAAAAWAARAAAEEAAWEAAAVSAWAEAAAAAADAEAAWAARAAAAWAARAGVNVAAIAGQVLLPDWQDNEEAER